MAPVKHCPRCGAPAPVNAPYCPAMCGYVYPQPNASAEYDPRRTASVVMRLRTMAIGVYVIFGVTWGGWGWLWGAVIAPMALAFSGMDTGAAVFFGGLVGLVIGVLLGLAVAYFLVVWLDWAEQVLRALDSINAKP